MTFKINDMQLLLNELKRKQFSEERKFETKEKTAEIPNEDYDFLADNKEKISEQKEENAEKTHEEAETDYLDEHINKDFEPFKETPTFDWQKLFLGGIFNKIGAIAIIIALVVFVNLLVPFKGFAGFLAGFLFLGYGIYKRNDEKLKKFSEVLCGTGFALLFIMCFYSYTVSGFFNTVTVSIAAVLLLISTCIYAEKTETLSTPVIGLIGAYLTPICTSAEPEILLAYFIFVNIVSVIFSLKNRKANVINPVNLVLTMFIFLFLHFNAEISAAYPVVLWLIYIIYDFIRDKSDLTDNTLCYLNYGILTFFSVVLFKDSYPQLACLLTISTILYGGYAYRSRKEGNELYKFYEYSMLVNLWLAIFFAWDAFVNTLVWAVITPLITLACIKFDAKHLKGGIIAYYASCLLGAFYSQYDGEYCLFAQYQPILNPRFFSLIIPAVSMAISANLFKKYDFKIHNLLLFSGISSAYLYLIGEINSISAINWNIYDNKMFIYIITGFVYAINTLKLSSINNSRLFKIGSFVIFYIALTWLLCLFSVYPENYIPIFNLHFAAYASGIAACILYAKDYKDAKNIADIFKFIAITLGYLCLAGEICAYKSTGLTESFNKQMLLIILAFIYSMNMIKLHSKNNSILYKTSGTVLFSAALIILILLSFNNPIDYITLINLRFAAYIAAIYACLTFAEVNSADFYRYLAVFTGYILCTVESNSLQNYNENLKFAVSPLCAIYSGIITAFGIIKNKNFLMNAGIVLTIITIIRIFVFDLANIDTVWKVAAFFVLGLILLAISYIYASKRQNK